MSEKKLCPQCGEHLDVGARFCASCGCKLEAMPQSAAGENSTGGGRETVEAILAEIDAMAGKDKLKKAARVIADGNTDSPNHIALTGNSDIEQADAARILARLYKAMGVLPTDKVTEVLAFELKGAYIGLSLSNVRENCGKAKGGVLFIAETQVLVNENGPTDSFAKEAAEALMMSLVNNGKDFVCIAGGSPGEMDYFLDKISPGMRRRFKHIIALN